MRRPKVGLVSYQAGNVQSLVSAFQYIDADITLINKEEQFKKCTHLVLPGVGAFGFCAKNLLMSNLFALLKQAVLHEQKPLLGICVGMQLLGDYSEESLEVSGLGWIGGDVKRFTPALDIRVPHVGWNQVEFEEDYGLFRKGDKKDFYFDHSFAYHHPKDGKTVGYCTHGVTFSAIIEKNNITAAQFHPEKSQESGLRFLKSFLTRCL